MNDKIKLFNEQAINLDICSDEDITVQVERYVKEYFGVEQ